MVATKRSKIWRLIRAVVYLGIGLYFFLIPGFTLVGDLNDLALRSAAIPRAAWRLHENLAPRYAAWAKERLASQRAAHVETENVAGTEWPLFGSVFYLWSLESLQKEWLLDHSRASMAPAVYARPAIEAAVNLVTDPNQAAWVKRYWGENYLHQQDLFYRFLLISAMTSYTNLTGESRFVNQLRDQVETLSAEIDASPHGWLEDYPGQCYPTDVVGAIAAIRRADEVLKTNHSAFVQRAMRAYREHQVDDYGLPPYAADFRSGKPLSASRGCGTSFALICAPEIWPSLAPAWYQAY